MRSGLALGVVSCGFGAWLWACGGIAVIDGNAGAGGAGGATASVGSNGSSSSGNQSSSSTGGPGSLCGEVCAQLDLCFFDIEDCLVGCGSNDVCLKEQDAWLKCLIDEGSQPPTCAHSINCAPLQDELALCTGATAFGTGCMGDQQQCSCAADLQNGNSYESICGTAPGSECLCVYNNSPIGACTELDAENVCDPFDGCCGTLFTTMSP